MARRNSLYEPSELRARFDDSARPRAYGYEIRSRALEFQADVLHISRRYSENQIQPTLRIEFAEAYLPPNRLHPKVTLLKDRPDLARIVVAVVDAYMIRQQNTKSTANTARSLAGTVIRFLEYCWLNDIYHLKDVTSGRWEEFLRKYAADGWPLVLELERRAAAIDWRILRLSRRKHKKGVVEYSCSALLAAIGANIVENQVRIEYARGSSSGVLRRARGEGTLSESSISQVISQLNNLVDLPREMRAQSLAHVNPYVYASTVDAVQPNRTENFDPHKLAALMGEAYRWVSIYGELIVKLAGRTYAQMSACELEAVEESRLFIVLDAPETRELEKLLGVRVTTAGRIGDLRRGVGLVGLMRTLLAACFLLLGVFNGRRKDEIQSRSIGLYSDAFECLDDKLRLFQSYFYCEKTTHDYRLFFVNELSFKALTMCKALSDIAWAAAERNGGTVPEGQVRKLFCMPPRGTENVPIWYDYSTDPGIMLLSARATGDDHAVVPNAHMFRRAYAVVFHYRYENADLYALSQQLDHRDLSMTLHYVLEGPSRLLAHHAATLWGDGGETKKARALHAAQLAAEVKDYGKIKLHDDVLEILTGNIPVAGGFARLIQRFTRKMYGRIKYDDSDLRRAATGVSEVLTARGHSVTPLPHGNCNAGPAKPGAACFDGGRLARERASPLVCGACPYHSMKEVHFQAVQEDLARQSEEASRWSGDSIQAATARESRLATEKLVEFYIRKREAVAVAATAARP